MAQKAEAARVARKVKTPLNVACSLTYSSTKGTQLASPGAASTCIMLMALMLRALFPSIEGRSNMPSAVTANSAGRLAFSRDLFERDLDRAPARSFFVTASHNEISYPRTVRQFGSGVLTRVRAGLHFRDRGGMEGVP